MTGWQSFGIVISIRFEKKTAKTASRTMTRKIDWTTAVVVRDADFLAVALNLHALEAAGERNDEAEHRRLDQANPQVGHRDHFLRRWI